MNFTPGPWEVKRKNGRPGVWTLEGSKVASVEAPHMIPPLETTGRDANARLIAASPEMYEALRTYSEGMKMLIQYAVPYEIEDYNQAFMKKIDALLAKINGGE